MTKKLVALAFAVLTLGVATYQPLTRGYIFANIGTLFSWSGSAQSWSGSTVVATCSDWTSFIKNDGTSCSPGVKTLLDSFAIAHAVNSVTHSPLVANNTFSNGNFASWTSTNSGGCNGYVFTGQGTTDQDGDNGLASGSSASCTSTAAVVNLSQSFSTGGAPTSQTYSFWYNAPVVLSGDPNNCTQGQGSVSLVASINGTNLPAITVVNDGAWHRVNGSTALLVNGSNTFKVAATLSAASGTYGHWNSKIQAYVCTTFQTVKPQTVLIDDVVLSGIW